MSLCVLVGLHLMDKSDALLVREEIIKLTNSYDCNTAHQFTCYNWLEHIEVYVERIRVLSLSDMVIYDIDIADLKDRGLQILGFRDLHKGEDRYKKVNCCGLKITYDKSFSVVPMFYNGELVIDLKEYGGSNIVYCELRGCYHNGGCLGIYLDAKTGRLGVVFRGNKPQLIYGDFDLVDDYKSSKFKGSMYLAVLGNALSIDRLMPNICKRVSKNVFMLYNGAVLVGTYGEKDITNYDFVIPDGVTDVYFGRYSDKYRSLNNYILPKSIKNIYKYEFFEAPRNLAFTFDKSISLSVLKEMASLCGVGFITTDNKEELIKALRVEGVTINLLDSEE